MIAHEEDGHLTGTTDFDIEQVERNVFGFQPEEDLAQITPRELAAAEQAFTQMLAWVWQSGMKNPEGVKIRAIIVCWVFLKHLRPMTLSELAQGYGMKKQSLGRWVDQFKTDFPKYRIAHMRNGVTNGLRRRWPTFVEALSRFSKFAGLVDRYPITKWPAAARHNLRQGLAPINAQLARGNAERARRNSESTSGRNGATDH